MSIKRLTVSEVGEVIAKIGASATAIQAQIHQCAVSTLEHVKVHGDYRGAQALLNALPNGQRVKALATWFRKFSNKKLIIKQGEGKRWEIKLADDRKPEDFDVDASEAITFADLTTEKNPEPVTVESLIRNLARSANNTDMHDGTSIPKVSPEARAVAASLVAFYRANCAKAA